MITSTQTASSTLSKYSASTLCGTKVQTTKYSHTAIPQTHHGTGTSCAEGRNVVRPCLDVTSHHPQEQEPTQQSRYRMYTGSNTAWPQTNEALLLSLKQAIAMAVILALITFPKSRGVGISLCKFVCMLGSVASFPFGSVTLTRSLYKALHRRWPTGPQCSTQRTDSRRRTWFVGKPLLAIPPTKHYIALSLLPLVCPRLYPYKER